MAGRGISRKVSAGAHDFGLGVAIAGGIAVFLLLALVLSRSGVSGTISRSNCQPGLGNAQHCSMGPVPAVITVTRPTDKTTWKAKSDAGGHFHVDLPPGGYLLVAQENANYGAQTSFPVRAGQVTRVDLLLLQLYQSISGGICLASSDRIGTPSGPIQVNQLRPGTLVWTLDRSGLRVAAPVLIVSHVPAPTGHHVLRLVLADGRHVEASAGHPTLTGRLVGTFRPGDLLDGSPVIDLDSIPYAGDTWDLLPAGPTGVYWANDVLLASTLGSQPLQLHAA
jgi:hypothetical protein